MPRRVLVVPGDRYGKLTIVREVERKAPTRRRFECICDCGEVVSVNLADMRTENTLSCGCWQRQQVSEAKSTLNGRYDTPEYHCWRSMIERCTNDNLPDWNRYGGRGISVSPIWQHDFAAFLSYMGPRPSPQHSLDRYPNMNGNYEPGNVRWATRKEQSRNTRRSSWVQYQGERRLMIEVCEQLGLNYGTIKTRQLEGWPESNLFDPIQHKYRNIGHR